MSPIRLPIISDIVDQREENQEYDRQFQARQGKVKIQGHMKKQKKMSTKLWDMGKRALQLGDRKQFASICKQYLWTLDDIKRWDRYLLAYESVEARRDQARSMKEFMKSINAMSKSMMVDASPKALAESQRNLELGIARAQNVEQRMDYIMEMTDETIFNFEDMDDKEQETAFKALEQEMMRESTVESEKTTAQSSLDAQIDANLKAIEQEMRKDLNK